MRVRRGLSEICNRSFLSAILVAIATFCAVQPSLAKHRSNTTAESNGDPCAAPSNYVRQRIDRIKALQAPTHGNGNSNLFDMLGGRNDTDPQKSVEISDLRYEADGVNALLAAGGCKAFDLDHELSGSTK